VFTISLFWVTEKEVLLLHTKVDLVVTLGGDGTVLWVSARLLPPGGGGLEFRRLVYGLPVDAHEQHIP